MAMIACAVAVLLHCQAVFSQGTGFFWHITDLHYDPWYGTPGGGISCNEHIAHPGEYGDFECDSPWKLVENSIHEIRDLDNSNPAFILWSGDNPPHIRNSSYNHLVDNDMIIDITRNITKVMMESFPGKIVLPMVGNHDYYPKNQLPGDGSELYDAFLDMWVDWINETDMQETFRKGAYYKCLVSANPRVHAVVLNTNLYYHSNDVTAGQDDPGGQMTWFEETMTNIRAAGEKAYLFYHVPFGKVPEPVEGKGWLDPDRNKDFTQLIIEYSDVILGGFSAHSHTDVYKLFYNGDGTLLRSLMDGSGLIVSAHVFTHIPPGIIGTNSRMFRQEFNIKFIEWMITYSDVILGSYGVHTHTDELRLFYDNNGNAVTSMFIAPSVTPWRVPLDDITKTPPHNPGLRKVLFDATTFELQDYEQYVLDLPRANEGFLKWYQSYRFTSIYQVSDIQPATLHSLLEEFKEFANEKFHHYYEAVYTDTTNVDGYMPCGCDCKTSHLCAIEHVDYDAYEQCIDDGDISCDATKLQFLGALIVMSHIVTKFLT